MDPNDIQQRMNEMQSSESFSNVLGKILSGKSGYKPVIEKKHVAVICKSCNKVLDDVAKFCPECGTKVEKPVAH